MECIGPGGASPWPHSRHSTAIRHPTRRSTLLRMPIHAPHDDKLTERDCTAHMIRGTLGSAHPDETHQCASVMYRGKPRELRWRVGLQCMAAGGGRAMRCRERERRWRSVGRTPRWFWTHLPEKIDRKKRLMRPIASLDLSRKPRAFTTRSRPCGHICVCKHANIHACTHHRSIRCTGRAVLAGRNVGGDGYTARHCGIACGHDGFLQGGPGEW